MNPHSRISAGEIFFPGNSVYTQRTFSSDKVMAIGTIFFFFGLGFVYSVCTR